MIVCRVLGPVDVAVDGAPAPPELLWRKHLALLVYLARSPKRARTREHLTGLLWPEKDESAARHSLNEALRLLRRVMGDLALDTGAGQVRLDAAAVHLDTDDLDRWIEGRNWADASAMVAGEFLEGFSVPGCERVEEWLAAERRWWAGRSVTALLGASDASLRMGRVSDALSAAQRAAALDPHSDAAVQAMMRALAVGGDLAAALGCAERFAAILSRDTGGAPSADTRQLAERIRGARGVRAAGTPSAVPASGFRRAPLTGRSQELERMLALWDRCRQGGATAIVLDGDSGIGKTRLIEEFATRVRFGGGTVALVRAVQGDGEEAGSGILGLARGGLLEAPGLATAPPPALAAFAAVLPEWGERFRHVPREGGMTPAQAFGPVLAAALGDAPVLLVVDDAHWMDRASLLSLGSALRDSALAPLGVLFAALPHPPREDLDELRRRLGSDLLGGVFSLGPLDGDAIRSLAAWALPGYDTTALARVCRRIGSDSAGLPFLAVELLSAVAQGLDVQQGPAAWPVPMHTLTQTLPGDLPGTVVAALRIGFRRLSQEAQQVLAAAAVLGDPVGESLLARATALAAGPVQTALDELEWQRWLETDGRSYGFVAQLARLVIAQDMVTPGQRRRLRERAGLPLETGAPPAGGCAQPLASQGDS